MGQLLKLKIDVTKIDKSKLFKGQKGTYLDVTLSVNDQPDEYGNDCSLWQEQTKEERDNKSPRNFLGSGRILWKSEAKTEAQAESEDDLPF